METENDASNNNGRDAEIRPRKKDINIYMSVDSKRRVKGTWVCGYAGSGRATNPVGGIGGKNPASPPPGKRSVGFGSEASPNQITGDKLKQTNDPLTRPFTVGDSSLIAQSQKLRSCLKGDTPLALVLLSQTGHGSHQCDVAVPPSTFVLHLDTPPP